MFSFQQEFDVPADRKLVIVLPPEATVGERVAVAVTTQAKPAKRPRTSLADLAEKHAVDFGPDVSSESNGSTAIPSAEDSDKLPRTSLSKYFKEHGEDWGDQIKSTDVEGFTGRKF
jgi:hypothetical protein